MKGECWDEEVRLEDVRGWKGIGCGFRSGSTRDGVIALRGAHDHL